MSGPALLGQYAGKNLQQWTFSKPANPPVVQKIVYEFKLEGPRTVESHPQVSFDLPDRVTIVTQFYGTRRLVGW